MNPSHFVISSHSSSNNRLVGHNYQSESPFSESTEGWPYARENLKFFRSLNVVGSFSRQNTVPIQEDRSQSQMLSHDSPSRTELIVFSSDTQEEESEDMSNDQTLTRF